MSKRPNIFDYATSELSQDAFICWLVAHVNCDDDPELQECARDFVAMLYNLHHESEQVSGSEVASVANLKQQHLHTDVYFDAVIKGETVSFIVEDKTGTSHHSGQLRRYLDGIGKEGTARDELLGVYFKTGYMFPEDTDAADHGFALFDLEALNTFLQGRDCTNRIYRDYSDFILRKASRRTKRQELLNGARFRRCAYDVLFSDAGTQFEYMKSLRCRIAKLVTEDAEYIDLSHGMNIGGYPWTQMGIDKNDNQYEDKTEHVFLRFDFRNDRDEPDERRKSKYYLSLRQYAYLKDQPDLADAKKRKLDRLGQMIKIFDEVAKDCGLKPGRIRQDWSGAFESEIGIFFFEPKGNTPPEFLDHLPKVLCDFRTKARAAMLFG